MRALLAVACLGLLAGCGMSYEQQLQAAREHMWKTYGGRHGGACATSEAGPSPQAPAYAPAANGTLRKSVIKDVIHSHIGEVRNCYDAALDGWPDLQGRVTVKFVIQPDGSVHPLAVAETTLNNRPTECCIAGAVRRWRFPPPDGGGIVVVTYPFVLEQLP